MTIQISKATATLAETLMGQLDTAMAGLCQRKGLGLWDAEKTSPEYRGAVDRLAEQIQELVNSETALLQAQVASLHDDNVELREQLDCCE